MNRPATAPVGGWRRLVFPVDGPKVGDGELAALLLGNLLATAGVAGDVSQHLRGDGDLGFGGGVPWTTVTYIGVTLIGLWLTVGVVRRGVAFLGSAATATAGFVALLAGCLLGGVWHRAFGSEGRVEALVSPPHLLVAAGAVLVLSAPVVVVWTRPARRLGFVPSVAVVLSVVSALLVVSLFTGFLSPLASGGSLRMSELGPLVGEGQGDADQIRALGIAVWTVVLLIGAFTTIFVRFRLTAGITALGFILLGVPPLVLTSPGLGPLVAGFAVAGLVAEACVFLLGRPTLGRGAATFTGAILAVSLWGTTFAALARDGRLMWGPSLWGGTLVLVAMVGAAVASLVALPAPTDDAVLDMIGGPAPA